MEDSSFSSISLKSMLRNSCKDDEDTFSLENHSSDEDHNLSKEATPSKINNIWNNQTFTSYYENSYEVPELPVGPEFCFGWKDYNNKLDNPGEFPGNPNGQRNLDPSCIFLSPSSSVDELNNGQDLNDPSNIWKSNQKFSNMTQNDQFQEQPGNQEYCQSLFSLWSPQLCLIMLSTTLDGSLCLQKYLEIGPEYTEHMINGFGDSIIVLMSDDNGKNVFDKLVKACNKDQLDSLMIILESQQESFVNAALSYNGRYSIESLIRKVKKTPHASTITKILSTRFCKLMMHRTGMHAIFHCLIHFRTKENEVFYNETIRHSLLLATEKMGCVSLNICINSITGSHREELLHLIADHSRYLSHDPSGNFVVQHVLALGDVGINSKICQLLEGEYVKLAMTRHGSHVVQKCIQSSQVGMILAVKDILSNEKTAFQLARDQFGNYVIQAALKQTKLLNMELYVKLTMALLPHFKELMLNKPGKHVLCMINSHFPAKPIV